MKKIVFLLFIAVSISAQGQFESFLERINSLPSADRQAVADSFRLHALQSGIPFIESDSANFLYYGSDTLAYLAGDMNGWSADSDKMTRVEGTNFFYITREYESNARLDYKFVVNESNWILDPLNPNTCSGGYGPNSELAMPAYDQPWEIDYYSDYPHGSISNFTFYSDTLKRNYQVRIYKPAGYDPDRAWGYPTAYFQDGSDYIDYGYTKNILDNLYYANDIDAMLAVFVTPTDRNGEYVGSERIAYTYFFANELVPYIDDNYNTAEESRLRAVIGDSYGGNISARISYYNSSVFGKCGIHSGAFSPNSYETFNIWMNNNTRDVDFYSVWGTYESLYGTMRNFRDSLTLKGYDFLWGEFPEGHSWGLWRATIGNMLAHFFPPGIVSIEDRQDDFASMDFSLEQNYPNPFNPSTKISFSLKEAGHVKLEIINLLGQVVTILQNGNMNSGKHQLTFNAGNLSGGCYFYRLTAGNNIFTKKMMLLK